MRVFEEFNGRGVSTGNAIMILDKKEGAIIMEALEVYYNQNKRRKTIKSILDYLENTLPFV
jgi:hypothetical protein